MARGNRGEKWRELSLNKISTTRSAITRASGSSSHGGPSLPPNGESVTESTSTSTNTSRRSRGIGTSAPPYSDKWRELSMKQKRSVHRASVAVYHDSDTAMFISTALELKEDGNRLFLKRDYEGALIKYDKSIKLFPDNHADVSYVRTNMAECYMQLGIREYPRAIHECNLALQVTPSYTKAFMKRARCYEALDRPDLALRDIQTVLKMEPNNLIATEIEQRLNKTIERQGSRFPELHVGDLYSSTEQQVLKSIHDEPTEEKNTEDKLVVEEKISNCMDNESKHMMKLVFGEDIRWVQIPLNCAILKFRQIISDRFPYLKAVQIKYKDEEGDMVTITTSEELRWAEKSNKIGFVKLYIFEVSPDQDPLFGKIEKEMQKHEDGSDDQSLSKTNEANGGTTCISDWIIQFAVFFKSYVGFDIDTYIDIHQVGMNIYAKAMEEKITSNEAEDLLNVASDKFLEMAALALFNCGNVHLLQARKKVHLPDDSSGESMLQNIKSAYDWAQKEYSNAGKRYEEALKTTPNFYEAVLALGQQQFEQAKLSWYYAVATGVDLETWPSGDALMLYNNAEENMETGMQMWENQQQRHLNDLSKTNRIELLLQKMKLDNLFKEVSADEIEEQATNIQSQIYVLWGCILYERSMMEYKLGVPVWHECLEAAVEKFELAGASDTDITVMVKYHCSNDTSSEGGLGFNIDEIVQAWNEMYEAKKWQHNIPSFRLEPLLRRRISKLYQVLERL